MHELSIAKCAINAQRIGQFFTVINNTINAKMVCTTNIS